MLYFSSQLRFYFNFKHTLNVKKILLAKKSSMQTFYKKEICDGKSLTESTSNEVSMRDANELTDENANDVDPGKMPD